MTVGVVIVNYRNPDRVIEALRSFWQFAGVPVDAVVVDNGGGERLAQLGDAVHLIRNDRNVGYAAAVNQGVAAIAAEVVLLLNPDVTGWRGALDSLLQTFADRSVVAVSPRLLDAAGGVEHSVRRAPRPFDFLAETLALSARFPRWSRARRLRMLDWDHDDERDVEAVTGACLFIRRSAFNTLGTFDEQFFLYGEEIDWLVRAGALGWRTRFVPSVSVTHAGGESTPASQAVLERLLIESHYRYTAKHFGKGYALALRALVLAVDCIRIVRHPQSVREFAARSAVHLGVSYERPV